MNNVHAWASVTAVAILTAAACGGDDEAGGGGNGGTTQTTSTSSGSGGTATGTATGTGSGTGTGTGTGSGTQSGTSTGAGACDSWLVTYDLTGSVFFIDALIDFTITCQEPYDADHNMGPGTITLRFPDDGGAPGAGPVTVVDYQMTQNFVTGISLAQVTTTLETSSVGVCGVASGTLAGDTVAWGPAEMAPYCRDGQVSCSGALCGTSGSPPEGQPVVFSNDCSVALPLNDFVFTAGIDAFTMAAVTTSQDNNQTTTLSLVGTKISEELDPATPGCACD